MSNADESLQLEFADRVMAAIARQSPPTTTRTFLSALRALSPRDAASALSVAWHLGTARGLRIAPGVRARSMALVLGVVLAIAASGSLATAAAIHVVRSGADQQGQVENGQRGVDQRGELEHGQRGVDQRGQVEKGQAGVDQRGQVKRGQAGRDQNGQTENGQGD